MRRRRDSEAEGCLQVRLLEDGEHAAGIGDLELRVEVHLVVHGINEAVQSLAGVHVARVCHDHQFVGGGERGQLDADAVGHLCGIQFRAVEGHPVDVGGDRIDERGRALLCGEPDNGGAAEDLIPAGEVQIHVVRFDIDQFSAFTGFGPREIHTWQGAAFRKGEVRQPSVEPADCLQQLQHSLIRPFALE